MTNKSDMKSKKVFVSSFSSLSFWSVQSQHEADWQWPADTLRPLGNALRRRVVPNQDITSTVTLLTIRFDGSIEERKRCEASAIKGQLYKVDPGDVVFSKIDVRNGAIGIAPELPNMCVTSEFPVYEVDPDQVDRRYIKMLLRSDVFRAILNSMISGATGRKRISSAQLENIEVPLPPLHVQKRIADYSEEAEQAVSDALAEGQAIIADLDSDLANRTDMAALSPRKKSFVANFSLLPQWDTKRGRASAFVGSNPGFLRLGDFLMERSELVRPWAAPDTSWPVYGVSNTHGVFLSSMQLGSQFNTPYKRVQEGWFFHNPTRANVGSLGMVPSVEHNALTSPEYQVWSVADGLDKRFVALLLRTQYLLRLIDVNRVGAVKQRMYYSNLAEIRIPKLSEKEIASYVNRSEFSKMRLDLARAELAARSNQLEHVLAGSLAIESLPK